MPSRWLVFGLTGQVGQALQERLPLPGVEIVAVTRQSGSAAHSTLRWHQGRLPDAVSLAEPFPVVLSLGPLDLFVQWFEQAPIHDARVLALGSMSLRFKANSPDPAERELAQRLRDSEARLHAAGRARGCAVTVLRPSLLYGNGLDRSLTPLLALAKRWRICPLPLTATGRRQPVHVADVVTALLACLDEPQTIGKAYDLPGGESLELAAMLRRALAARAPGARLLPVPTWVFRLALRYFLWRRGAPLSAEGIVARMDRDQLADAGPAERDFGYRPRGFLP